jgi:ribonuclease HI
MEKKLVIHTDGGSRGNPGMAACAFVADDETGEIYKSSKYLGIATNNFAEYSALLLAVNWLLTFNKNSYSEIVFYLDSELVVNQINGKYKIKDLNLFKLYKEVKDKLVQLNLKTAFIHIPRSENKTADRLVNMEMDENPVKISRP